jgi:hypothetical protein
MAQLAQRIFEHQTSLHIALARLKFLSARSIGTRKLGESEFGLRQYRGEDEQKMNAGGALGDERKDAFSLDFTAIYSLFICVLLSCATPARLLYFP